MRSKVIIATLIGAVLIVLSLAIFSRGREHDPKDLSFWIKTGADREWSLAAAQGRPEAQFQVGLSLIRTNLVKTKDQVPGLSAIPVLGKRFFETVTYRIDGKISQTQRDEAHQWIKKSADQGFAPAKEAEKLFIPGR